ncbi:MAG: 1,4-alpha-glucan branching enzyme, partial [Microvirga sp.]
MTLVQDNLLAGIDAAGLRDLVEGRSGDALAVLGAHPAGQGRIVRVFMPGATGVALLDRATGDILRALDLVDPGGLFAGQLDHQGAYTLRITWPDAVQETEDPYSF